MLGRPRVSVVLAACLAAALLPLGSAWASSTPTDPLVVDPSPTTVETSPVVAPTDTIPPAPSASADPTTPTDPAPITPVETPAQAPSLPQVPPTGPAAAPDAVGPTPAAPEEVPVRRDADGVAPVAGQVDEYLRLSTQQTALVAEVAERQAAVTAADLTVAQAAGAARDAALDASVARVGARASDRDVDDVVRDLYQSGDSGLSSIATILTAGPDGLIDRIDAVRQARTVSNGVVRTAEAADLAVRLAEVTETSAGSRLRAAVLARTAAQTALASSKARLGDIEEQMTRLGAVAPQVAVGPEGCPTTDVPATLRDGAWELGAAALCRFAVKNAGTPQAALAITWAFLHLGAQYACGGTGRMLPFRADCSSLVSRAYAEGAGLRTSGDGWAPSTRNMVPWDGVALDPHYAYVAPQALRPGDLVLYDTCPQGGCPYKHVVMYLGSPDGQTAWMLHTNSCGDVAKVEQFWGFPSAGSHTFLVARRVVALPGETVRSGVAVAAPAQAPAKKKPASKPAGSVG